MSRTDSRACKRRENWYQEFRVAVAADARFRALVDEARNDPAAFAARIAIQAPFDDPQIQEVERAVRNEEWNPADGAVWAMLNRLALRGFPVWEIARFAVEMEFAGAITTEERELILTMITQAAAKGVCAPHLARTTPRAAAHRLRERQAILGH